ncbi:DNA primase family protein [Streptomyces sp. BPTC-684]|uniref:DNA primase family protein n=1 Tax=Streptomyces sp. BPTC-684 TaxID=3043734 RepID=UPI0024B148FA|nr:DNA primase family protein [Streptomyces sp. BPTC-684]WHM37469.1 phage/plasmid primase, P4 family [Streptomyces sp. BPTC-684]
MTASPALSPEQLAAVMALVKAANEDPGGYSDDELAQALFEDLGTNVRFDRATGWALFPVGAHAWQISPNGLPIKQEAQNYLRRVREKTSDEKAAKGLGSRARRDAVVDMLSTLPGVLTSGQRWDQNPDLLACANGVVDLRTGTLHPGEPNHMITRSVATAYDPAALCPRWMRFLGEVFPGDPELPAYVQRLIGYGITGHTSEQVFAVLYGEGSNGKSVFLNTLRALFAEHAATVPFDMFTSTGNKRGGADAELLRGARLALASETNRGAVLDAAAIKNATGGEEMSVNPKYRDPYSFKPEALILLATNYRPEVREQDHGTWRRVKLLPFERKFSAAERDSTLDETLRGEFPGILAWAVRGAREWYSHGLGETPSVVQATAEYREDSDPLAGFFPGTFVADPAADTPIADIWEAYKWWAEAEGIPPFKSSRTLVSALIERDSTLQRGRTSKAKTLIGLKLADDRRADAGPGIFA